MSRLWFAAACSIALLCTACRDDTSPVQPAPTSPSTRLSSTIDYEVIDLGTLGGPGGTATDLDESARVVVGYAATADLATHAFVWEAGVMRDLGTLIGGTSFAWALNDRGQIAGNSAAEPYDHRMVIWENGVIRDLSSPVGYDARVIDISDNGDILVEFLEDDHGSDALLWRNGAWVNLGNLGAGYTYPTAWNRQGQVVGRSAAGYTVQAYPVYRPFLWQDGVMQDLDTTTAEPVCRDYFGDPIICAWGGAQGINDAGIVVGWRNDTSGVQRAFVWQDGQMRFLDPFPGRHATALAINERGHIAGNHFITWHDERGFFWDGSTAHDLGTLGGPRSSVVAMNEASEVIGWSQTSSADTHAFVWGAGRMYDLGPGTPAAINERGDIVGTSAGRPVLWRRERCSGHGRRGLGVPSRVVGALACGGANRHKQHAVPPRHDQIPRSR